MSETVTSLALLLRVARKQRNLSLRSVEDATGVSNAYLSQLEHGRIRQPSPVILHKLAELYGIPYTEIMQKAGYPVPPPSVDGGRATRSFARFADVTPDEERALAEYLEFLRTRHGPRSR
jgi:transcriptional regulator with XRE-family HTH domain